MTAISPNGRGTIRPCWELIYNHYTRFKGLNTPWSKMFADSLRPEGGGGHYGGNSGGFDQLGFGTLTFTADSSTTVQISELSKTNHKCNLIELGGMTDHVFRYSLSHEATVSVKIFDSRGVLKMQKETGLQHAGSHSMDLATHENHNWLLLCSIFRK